MKMFDAHEVIESPESIHARKKLAEVNIPDDNSEPFINDEVPEGEGADLSIFDDQNPVFLQAPETNVPFKLPAEVMQELPNANIEFRAVEGNANKILSLKDIQEQIIGDNKIDNYAADIVNEAFKDLFDTCVPKHSFTKIPTQVNLKETKNFMKLKIAKEEAELMDLYTTYIQAPLASSQTILKDIHETYLPGLRRITDSLKSELELNKDKIFNNPNATVTMTDGSFANMTTVDLLNLDPAMIKSELVTKPSFQQALNAIIEALKCPHTCSLVTDIAELEGSEEKPGISMVDLTRFILSDRLFNHFDQVGASLEKSLKELTDLSQQAIDIAAKPDLVAQFVVKHASEFSHFDATLKKHSSLVFWMTVLNLATKQLLLTYLEL